MLKCQQFESSKSEEKEPKVSKCHCLGMHDNKKRQNLDKYESKEEEKNIRCVFFLFVTPSSLPQKDSNRLTDMDEGTKCPNHFIYIPKIGSSYNC